MLVVAAPEIAWGGEWCLLTMLATLAGSNIFACISLPWGFGYCFRTDMPHAKEFLGLEATAHDSGCQFLDVCCVSCRSFAQLRD